MSTCVGCSAEVAVTASFCPRCGTPNPESPTIPTPTGGGITERIPPDELKLRLQRALGRDFLIDRMIGEGGFAVVFAVQDRKLSRRIAVKVLRPELTASKSTVQRFVREAESVAGLSHPHILPIFFVGEGEGLVYFGMPFVEGETLEARLTREAQLPEAEVVRIGAEIADALAEAHAAGLVHRDVKPANALLQGSRSRVLVADFGIAKAAAGSGNKLTGTGSVIGSPHYMSPEQAAGSDAVDSRSDIYSLGIVLWQMLAGAMPFDAPDTQGILVQHLTQPLPLLARKRPGVSPALVRIVEKCCAKRAEDRYQAVAEVAQALRTGQAPRLVRKYSTKRLAATAVVGVLVVAAAVAGLLPRLGPPIGNPGAAAVPDSTRSSAPSLAVLPFVVSGISDTAQWSRQTATSLASTIEERYGVATVDMIRLLSQWRQEGRSLDAPLDSNAAFSYRLRANQLVMGRVFQAGRQVRVAADVYDTHTLAKIGHGELDGSPDSLIGLLDRLAERVALALCRQPEFNPRRLCFDVPARPRQPLVATIEATPGESLPPAVALDVLIGVDGRFGGDAKPRGAVASDLLSAAVRAVQSAVFEPARKGRLAVESWSEVSVGIQRAAMRAAPDSNAAGCEQPVMGLRNPDHACFDTRATPRAAPIVAAPPECSGAVTPANILVRVSASGEVLGESEVQRRSNCQAFTTAATALVKTMVFAPARKGSSAVAAWVIVQMRPGGR